MMRTPRAELFPHPVRSVTPDVTALCQTDSARQMRQRGVCSAARSLWAMQLGYRIVRVKNATHRKGNGVYRQASIQSMTERQPSNNFLQRHSTMDQGLAPARSDVLPQHFLAHVRRNDDGSFAIHELEEHLRAEADLGVEGPR